MQLTPTITFRGVRRTAAIDSDIAERLRKLETFYDRIMGCRVLVELVQRHHEAGNRYHVRIDLTVPGEEIVVAHDATLHAAVRDVEAERLSKGTEPDPAHKHVRVAIREAFDAARRQLQDFARRQQGAVKATTKQPRGRVSQLFPIDEYGYIEAEDGHEVYFQKSSVLNDAFERMTVGSAVAYVEERGDKGPQASTVRLLHASRSRRTHRAAAPEPVRG